MKNSNDQHPAIYNKKQHYHIQLDGVLHSAEINWSGDVSIIDQPEDQSILVSLVVHEENLRRFLDHFEVIRMSVNSELMNSDNGLGTVTEIDVNANTLAQDSRIFQN